MLTVNSQYIGERKDLFFDNVTFTQEEVDLDPYLLINTGISYETGMFRLFAHLKNILNADYSEVYGFSTPGIHGSAGISFTF
jgi:outer membrane cobalamin receptor